jgi:hypothetical protein
MDILAAVTESAAGGGAPVAVPSHEKAAVR